MRESAEGGDTQAQANYARSWEIRGNFVQAHMWYNIAATRAPDWAYGSKKRGEIAAKMTSEQLAEAEQKAAEWLAAHPPSSGQDGL
jgi:hypothetical protein